MADVTIDGLPNKPSALALTDQFELQVTSAGSSYKTTLAAMLAGFALTEKSSPVAADKVALLNSADSDSPVYTALDDVLVNARHTADSPGANDATVRVELSGGGLRKVTLSDLRYLVEAAPGFGLNYCFNPEVNSISNLVHTCSVLAGGYFGNENKVWANDHSQFPAFDDYASRTSEALPNHAHIIGYDNLVNHPAGLVFSQHGHLYFRIGGTCNHGSLIGGSWHKGIDGAYSICAGGSRNMFDNDFVGLLGGTRNVGAGSKAGIVGSYYSEAAGEGSAIIGGENLKTNAYCSAVIAGLGSRTATTAASGASAGATSIVVASATNFIIGRRVCIFFSEDRGGSGRIWFTTITNVVSTTITLADALPEDLHASDDVLLMTGQETQSAYSVILAGRDNYIQTGAEYSVAMGLDAEARTRATLVVAGEALDAVGDKQALTYCQGRITTDATPNQNLAITGTNNYGRFNPYGENFGAAGGYVTVLAQRESDGAVAMWQIPYVISWVAGGAGTEIHGDIVGDVTQVVDNISIATNPTIDTNSAADIRVRVTGNAGETIKWVARFDAVMTHT